MSDARPALMIVFGKALELADPADRACGADAALREQVEALALMDHLNIARIYDGGVLLDQ